MPLKRLLIIVALGGAILTLLPYGSSHADYDKGGLEFVTPESLAEQAAPSVDDDSNNKPKASFVYAPEKSGASYRLGSGDKIKITVYGEPGLSDTYLVNEEGYISFPLVNEVRVKDLTIIEARRILYARLSNGFLIDPNIAIEVAEFRPIYVMGEVRDPGSYDFRTDMSVRNAVAIAGGFTYRANQEEIKVTRQLQDNKKTHIILGKDDKIHPGDVILIKERFF